MAIREVECTSGTAEEDCEGTFKAEVYGSEEKQEWKIENFDWRCTPCKNAEREAKNAASAAANAERGLPELEGSEKQVAWAETLRAERMEELDEYAERLAEAEVDGPEQEALRELAFERLETIRHANNAAWWIDHRDDYDFCRENVMRPAEKVYRERESEKEKSEVEEGNGGEETASKEDPAPVLLPEGEKAAGTLVACVWKADGSAQSTLLASLPEYDEGFRDVMHQAGLSWNPSEKQWERKIGKWSGPLEDRLAELAAQLAEAGFPCQLPSEELKEAAQAGRYAPEQKRWVLRCTSGEHEDWFVIRWDKSPGGEDLYEEARALPKSRYDKPWVVVPAYYYEEVRAFAEEHGFEFSGGAKALAEEAAEGQVESEGTQPPIPKPSGPLPY